MSQTCTTDSSIYTLNMLHSPKNKLVSVVDLANMMGNINYEVVNRINPIIQRIVGKTI